MTDRIKGVTVCFDRDIREDDAECLINAIKMIKGVASVESHVRDHNDWLARERVKSELKKSLYDTIKNI